MMSIAGMPEINYERYLSESMGVGMAVAFSIENAKDMHLRSMALPYCRIYFGQKRDDGFFIEGNMAMVNQQEEITESINNGTGQITTTNSSTNFGFGAATGFKLLARGGVTGEVYLGVGRLFGNSISGAYPRCGLCIGKRF